MQMTGRWLGMVGLSLAAFLVTAAPLAAQAQKPTTPGYPVTPGYTQVPGYPQAPRYPSVLEFYGVPKSKVAPVQAVEAIEAKQVQRQDGTIAVEVVEVVKNKRVPRQDVQIEVEVVERAVGVPLLSKLPYVSKLFKNVARGFRVQSVETAAAPAECAESTCPAKQEGWAVSPPRETVDAQGVIGIDFDFNKNCNEICQPHFSQPRGVLQPVICDVGTCQTATCTNNGACVTATGCGVATACTSAACTAGACAASSCATGSCECGAGCKCCQGATVAGPVQWFSFAPNGVHLPTIFDGHRIAIHAGTLPAPHISHGPFLPHPPIANPHVFSYGHESQGHTAGCPFKGMHETLVDALTEKAALQARLEAREEMIEHVLELATENAKLKATAELAGKFLELKDQHAAQQREMWEHLLELENEKVKALAEAAIEKAKLEAQLELAEAQQEMIGEQVEVQVGLMQQTVALQMQAAGVEQLKAENDKLKAELAALRGEKSKAAAHTASLPGKSDESQE